MSLHARRPTTHLLVLALLAMIGLVGLFVSTGVGKVVFFLATCWPVVVGVRGYWRQRRAR